ncbi:hypothetical protein MNEG_11227 [Monoraphidium neglectum]|uniref:C3H1-type domain-containing protein n=1 Tax=Monoraphidium neglectum TaxID=145388 RepID=A0A0D2MQ13_9CHLO|nr:hypothetical protein MNEG_11227 [Monoraphidium neglectum]KIY96735.1 hypothetical protein MNEG_11227 [Monoraphidium neglectum]|eukprot:XP_013895755.1 hypothetical protein MNEG_11227 [Monoraphidium neglectum]
MHDSSQVCKFFLAGNCAYGDQCRFEHSGGRGDAIRPSSRRPPAGPGGGGPQYGGPPPPGQGEWSGGVYKWPSGADEFGLMESSDPNPNWDDYMDPEEMEAFELWQKEQLEGGGGGAYPDGFDGEDLVDPSDIPLCQEYEAHGACAGGDECPLIHGEQCEGCGRYAIHPYNPELIAAHTKGCGGAAAAGGGDGAGAAAAAEEGAAGQEAQDGEDSAAPAAAAEVAAEAGKQEQTAGAAGGASAADELAAGLEATRIEG